MYGRFSRGIAGGLGINGGIAVGGSPYDAIAAEATANYSAGLAGLATGENRVHVNPDYTDPATDAEAARDKMLDALVGRSIQTGAGTGNATLDELVNKRANKVFGKDVGLIPAGMSSADMSSFSTALRESPGLSVEARADTVADAVNRPDTTTGDALQEAKRSQARTFAADWAEFSKQMGRPGTTQRQRADLQRQFEERYPGASSEGWVPQAMTSEQYQEFQTQLRVQQANTNFAALQRGEMPTDVFTVNAKGEIDMAPGMRAAFDWKQKQDDLMRQQNRDTLIQQEKTLTSHLKALEAQLPGKPAEPTSRVPSAQAAYNTELQAYNEQVERADNLSKALWQKNAGMSPQYNDSTTFTDALELGHITDGDTVEIRGKDAKGNVIFRKATIINGIPVF